MAQAPYYNLDVITPHISSSPYLLYGSPHPALLGYMGGGGGGADPAAMAAGGLFPPIRGASPSSLLPMNAHAPHGNRGGSPTPSAGSHGQPFAGYGAAPEMRNGDWVVPQPPPPQQQQQQQQRALNGAAGGAPPYGGNNNNHGWEHVGQYRNNWGAAPNNNNNARPSVADMPAAGIRQGPGSPRRYDLISGSGPDRGGAYGQPHVSPSDLPAAGMRRGQRDRYNIVTNQGGYGNANAAPRAVGGAAGAAGVRGGGEAYGNFYQDAPPAGAPVRANRRYSNYLLNGYEEPVNGVRNIASSAVTYDIISGAPLR